MVVLPSPGGPSIKTWGKTLLLFFEPKAEIFSLLMTFFCPIILSKEVGLFIFVIFSPKN
jgi:hypothetical protein